MEAVREEISVAELVKLGAVDSEFYAHTFFPKTFRQRSPEFGKEIWSALENPNVRLLNLLCFRGSAKTTRLRTFASKRIAYGISRTVLCIGASERDAIRSVQWLRGQVERNRFWSGTFGLRPGRKWEETQIEIEHTQFGHTIWVLAAGITGSLRGINFDDYRPDLIIVDDPQTDEMAASSESREKTADLITGAVRNSLAPSSEEPNAKLVMAITPQHKDDVSQRALSSESWTSLLFPCWTKESWELPVASQESVWPERFPSDELRKQKSEALEQNKLSIFLREMECKLTSPETSQFRMSWINVRPVGVAPPRGCFSVLAIDPVPPPSERQITKGLVGKDFEAHYVWGRVRGEYHLLDRARNRGHDPSWSIATAFGLARRWKVSRIIVDAVAYQRTLKWLLEEEMKRRGIFYTVIPISDGMAKFARIVSVIGGLATHGKLHIGAEFTEFAAQYESYPSSEHDDDLDASALALQDLSNPYLEDAPDLDDDFGPLQLVRRCP